MLWRHLCLVRAWSAAGLLATTLTGASVAAVSSDDDGEPAPPADASAAVSVLDARKAGDLAVEVRGAGEAKVKMVLKNTSGKRLKVVVPPGLVASSAAGQGRGGGAGGAGGGFQSMGLGSVSNRGDAFGEFRGEAGGETTGFRSVRVDDLNAEKAIAVPAGKTIELTVSSVCLNYGVATPTPRDKFELVEVEEYSGDARVRKALRSLATYGTSHGVAQAAMWRVCNGVEFGEMTRQFSRLVTPRDVELAAKFVEVLDASGPSGLVDPAYLTAGRLFVRVSPETPALADDAKRLSEAVNGLQILGLPARSVSSDDSSDGLTGPAVLFHVVLTPNKNGETRGRLVVSRLDDNGRWVSMGKVAVEDGSAVSLIEGAGLARAIDKAASSAFVSVKVARRTANATVLKVDNRLPFTVAGLTVKVGESAGAPNVPYEGLGIAPGRSITVTIPAPGATVEHVDVNGL